MQLTPSGDPSACRACVTLLLLHHASPREYACKIHAGDSGFCCDVSASMQVMRRRIRSSVGRRARSAELQFSSGPHRCNHGVVLQPCEPGIYLIPAVGHDERIVEYWLTPNLHANGSFSWFRRAWITRSTFLTATMRSK